MSNQMISYTFLLPYLIFAIIFMFLPILYMIKLSFQQGTILDTASMQWVGLKNFSNVFTNSVYLRPFLNNVFYLVFAVPIGQAFAILMALLIRKKGRVNAIYENIFFLPLLIPMVSASIIISYILSNGGVLNYLLEIMAIEPLNWFGNPLLAKFSIVILELWKGATFYVFIYVASLRSIPGEYSDAARIDGANLWQETFKITLPLMKNAILLGVVLSTIFQFQIFESIFMMTGGGPLRMTQSTVFSIYDTTMLSDQIGSGAALSVVFMLFILIVSLLQMWFFRSDTEY